MSGLLEFHIAGSYTIFCSRYQFLEFRQVMDRVRSSSCYRAAVSAAEISSLVSAPAFPAAAHRSSEIVVVFDSTAANVYLISNFTCAPSVE